MEVDRLLARLDKTLGNDSSHLSQLDRNRIGANVDYARMLLLSQGKKAPSTGVQQSLAVVKRLEARLKELNALGDDSEESETEHSPAKPDPQVSNTPPEAKIRQRRPLVASDNRSAALTSALEELFSSRPRSNATHETIMTHNRTEQETLSTSLLSLAQQLKESAQQVGASIAGEKETLDRAVSGLDKSSQGMELAQERMGRLRRMAEGKNWWDRIKLYCIIVGLWLACFFLVFVMPKLRF
ncbi:hypothetical protein K470DRAFT_251348 [Piedraia hortae CBS 480.64]|uniref:Synaptobrevin n=1 Tax=Piedraia hortae CBS 480.64 TaxID=1314780 RepID=A0A6A7BT82_9PEZI|nr:hypothetical protein K470DRAFT_251348 [Piedraia hortae CBS 480.64]